MAEQQKIRLLRPREFQRRNRHLFPTVPALYRHLGRRKTNGMLESGAVIEAPTGTLLIDPPALESLHAMGVPQHIAQYAHSTVERLTAQLKDATPEQRQQHVDGVAATLRSRWGDKYAAKIDKIDEMVAAVPGQLGDALAAAPWMLADPLLMTQLDEIAQRRPRRK